MENRPRGSQAPFEIKTENDRINDVLLRNYELGLIGQHRARIARDAEKKPVKQRKRIENPYAQ